ncbi:hypothetical protein SAY87_007306 [Trapa incisa]|uniref:Uncharacterized protein n=1 Tax=Trapa incisa TaxID=236973 RepID=A0AAN7K0S6_9MYRT|nr:hypothetical protein SAY87_007306 [Trapa incisa]
MVPLSCRKHGAENLLRHLVQALSIRSNGGAGEGVDEKNVKNKAIVVGSGWAGLGAARHLRKQAPVFPPITQSVSGFLFEKIEFDANEIGCCFRDSVSQFLNLVMILAAPMMWEFKVKNIYSLVNELGIEPFIDWTKSKKDSRKNQMTRLLILRMLDPFLISNLLFQYAAKDFDNTDAAWRKYNPILSWTMSMESKMHFAGLEAANLVVGHFGYREFTINFLDDEDEHPIQEMMHGL